MSNKILAYQKKPSSSSGGGYKPLEEDAPLSKPIVKEETVRERAERQRIERQAELTFTQDDYDRWAKNRERVIAERSQPVIQADNAFWPPYNFLAEEGHKELHVTFEQPIKDYAWLSLDEAEEFAQNIYEDMGGKTTLGDMKTYGLGVGKGSYDAYSTAKNLGGLGVQAYTKTIKGQDWIIIKNYRKHLKTLERGHMWKANNPRIVQLGLGLNDLHGAARFVRFNVGLDIAVSIGVHAVDYALRDEATVAELVGNSAGDIVKGIISVAGGALITAAFAAPTATVLGTAMIFVGVSFAIGQVLNIVDKEAGYSELFVDKVREFYE